MINVTEFGNKSVQCLITFAANRQNKANQCSDLSHIWIAELKLKHSGFFLNFFYVRGEDNISQKQSGFRLYKRGTLVCDCDLSLVFELCLQYNFVYSKAYF